MAEIISIPLLLVAAAALLATLGIVNRGLADFLEGVRKQRPGAGGRVVQGGRGYRLVALLIAAALLLGGYGGRGILRIALDGADSMVPLIAPILAVEDAADKWLAEAAAKGVAGAALARSLNDAGHYRSGAPGLGLVTLLPNLAKPLGNLRTLIAAWISTPGRETWTRPKRSTRSTAIPTTEGAKMIWPRPRTRSPFVIA